MTNVGDDVGGNVGDQDDTKLIEKQTGILNLIKEMRMRQPMKCRRSCR